MDKGVMMTPGEELDAEGLFAAFQRPFELDGTFHFPACCFSCGTATAESTGDKLVQLVLVTHSMLGNHVGVFLRMTPEGAREVAGRLLADAQKVDNHVAEQAAAAIDKARKS